MNYKEQTKRYILFIISLFFSALGVAFTKHGELGVSPISSVANVVNCKFPAFSLGTLLIVWNCVLILGQILLLQKKFSTNPAFANTAFLPFWLVYRPWNVSGGIVSRNELFFTAYYGIAWNYHPWFRNFSFCYRQCNHEFR